MVTHIFSGTLGGYQNVWNFIELFVDTLHLIFFGMLFSSIIAGILTDSFTGK